MDLIVLGQMFILVCIVGDGNNGSSQTFEINVTNLPEQEVYYRVARTVSNGNWYLAPQQTLSLGLIL